MFVWICGALKHTSDLIAHIKCFNSFLLHLWAYLNCTQWPQTGVTLCSAASYPHSVLAPQSPQAVPWAREHGLLRLTRLTSSLGRDFLFYPSRVKATIVLVTFLHKGLVAQSSVHPRLSICPSQTLSECEWRWGCTDFYLLSPVGERSSGGGPCFLSCILTTKHGSGTRRGSAGSMRTILETHAQEPGVVLTYNPNQGAEAGR